MEERELIHFNLFLRKTNYTLIYCNYSNVHVDKEEVTIDHMKLELRDKISTQLVAMPPCVEGWDFLV